MLGKGFMAGVLAAAGVAAFALPVRAGDTQKLSLPRGAAEVPVIKLVDRGQAADVIDVARRGGFYGGGRGFSGYRGGRGFYGYRGGYYGGRGYYGYRGGYYGGRGFYGYYGGRGFYGYRRGYYGGYYGYPWYYGGYGGYYGGYGAGYYGDSCYYAPVYYSSPVYYTDSTLYPSGGVSVAAPYVNLSIQRSSFAQGPAAETLPAPLPGPVMPPPDQSTFPYDGGPRVPPPMPSVDPPAVPLPIDSKPTATPPKVAGKIVYPAYGERPDSATTSADHTYLVQGQPKK